MTGTDNLIKKIREPKKSGWMDFSERAINHIGEQLEDCGYPVNALRIVPEEYHEYFSKANYTGKYPKYYDFNIREKSLEHFLAAKLLELNPQDVYIDIASEGSPVPEIYNRLYGVKSYRQDLAYRAGLHGDTIGGNAANMPVPDGFASKMALHCSLEHFEGSSDTQFFQEAKRVLRSKGKICVVPFYIFEEYAIVTDPKVAAAQQVEFEPDAVVYCVDGWANRHGRYYDAQHFVDRIASVLSGCKITVYHILNAQEIDPSCYARFALLVENS